jgi:signal transduction histidine kinase
MDLRRNLQYLFKKEADAEASEGTLARLRNFFGFMPFMSSLRAKLIVPYVLLTLVTALMGLYVVTRLVASTTSERFDNQLIETGRVAADMVVRQENTHLENLRLLAFTIGVPELMADGDGDELYDLIFPLVANNGLEAVSAVSTSGIEILGIAEVPSEKRYITTSGDDFTEFDIVKRILEGSPDELGDKYAGILLTINGPYLYTTTPVEDESKKLVGVMMVGTSMNSLLAEIKSQALADVIVLNSDGTLLSTSFADMGEGHGALEIDPALMEDRGTALTREITLFGRNFSVAYSQFMLREQSEGIIGVALPSNFIISQLATSRNVLGVVFSLGTVGVIILGYRLAQGIAQPILRLREISQAVAAGDLDQHTGLYQTDEIGDLASAFDTMTDRLRERTEEAARLYSESIGRNEELKEINQRLASAQAQLIQSEKLAAVGQLTAGIVHDVRNPLAVIKGLAEDLDEEPGLTDYTRDSLATIRASANQANSIVSDLLKFARQSEMEMRHQDLRDSVASAVRLIEYLARKGNVQIRIDLPSEPVMATYDTLQIEQVIVNLITNAVQAMADGGMIRITLGEAEGAVAVAVQDTGTGIPEEYLLRIFDPFFTTKPEGEGTGLGLSVSFGIVSHHGGRIEVESEVGEGTTFTVLLPVDAPTPARQEMALESEI